MSLKIKALLVQDVESLGKAGEIVEISMSKFDRELRPKDLAVEATDINVRLWAMKSQLPNKPSTPRPTKLTMQPSAGSVCRKGAIPVPVSNGQTDEDRLKENPASALTLQATDASEVRTSSVEVVGLPRRRREGPRTVNPGVVSGALSIGMDPEERNIVTVLSKVWLVTRTRVQAYKGSDYLYAFVKPTETLKDLFHLDREVLVLFERDGSHRARALDHVDRLMIEFSNRLDRLCIILVSRDRAIAEKIRRFTSEIPESRVIVPFSYDELGSASPDFQLRRLKEHFFTRDLYSFSSPLKQDTYFFGRSKVVAHYYDKYKSGENSGLFGLRKTGKTSVLYALRRYLLLRTEPFVYIDCHDPAVHGRRWNEVLAFVVRLAAEQLAVPRAQLHSAEDYNPKDASICFEEDLKTLANARGGKRILLALDEIESITFGISPSQHWATDTDFLLFWQAMRAVFQRSLNLFSIIVTGVNPMCVETPTVFGVDNPIYRFIVPRYLSLFAIGDVKDMVSGIGKYMGLRYEEEVFTYLSEDYGGHPFLIRNVCSIVHHNTTEPRPVLVTKYQYRTLKDTFSRELFDYIEQILVVLRERYPNEYRLLEHLAVGNNEEFRKVVTTSQSLVSHLIGYGLIRQHEGNYYFTIQAVEEYVRTGAKVDRVLNTDEEKRTFVSVQRNRLEEKLRKTVKMVLKTRYGPVEARDKVLAAIEEKRRLRLADRDLNALLDGGVSEIYFLDLRQIVGKYWSDFEGVFRKDRAHFDLYTEFINLQRVDAHAKVITDDDLAILRIAMKWLDEAVTEYLE